MPDLPAQLYFAYGSNLWLQQMASRCPESYYVGRAILMDHRWQINSRGFANVIPCSGYNVHGLVYQVSVDDEARLDRNEGVHSGAYTKSYHSVVLHEAVEDLQLPTRYLVQDGGLDKAVNAVRSGSRSHEPEQQRRITSNVLVYLSSRYCQWGTARDEYVDRMNCGIRDAVTLGIPSDFFENTVRPSIPLSSDLSSEAPPASKLNGARAPGNDVVEIPQNVPIVLHDVLQGRGALCTLDELRYGVVYLQPRIMYAFNQSGPTYEQSATVDAPGSRMIRAASTLYFAYGSNLHLAQMAHRCPGSVFKGKATLESYRWQINERGVANVVESGSNHSVEGLLYMIGPKDERTLDRSEGVSKGFYQKYLMRVSFEPHQQYANFKTGRLSHLLEQRRDSMSGDGTRFPTNANRKVRFTQPQFHPVTYMDGEEGSGRHARNELVKALVYVSEDYITDGSIREEYIARMQNAVNDAVSLGVSKSFVNKYIVPFLDPEQIWHLCARKPTETHDGQPSKLLELESEPEAQAIVNGEPNKEQLGNIPSAENNVADISEPAGDEKSTDVDMNEESNQEALSMEPTVKEDNLSRHIDLSKLGAENHDEDGGSSGMFPNNLYEAVDKVNHSAIDGSGKNIYVVIVKHKGREANSGFSVAAASKGIQVANKLAMKEFKALCALNSKPVVEEEEPDVVVVKEVSPGDLTWKLEEDVYLHLSSTRPGEEPWLMVWVESKQLIGCQ
ncbi:hypothetical protein CEK26_002518 [Fusarium fujikuroi]|nr:hypothetical protein CEK27_002514 [Fusarium fujikuroi]QGI87545.1 hypothetical protein CEK25_002501 [Fusarium fujikuroi]QGJ01074.1 hypothetical protein CEK26_002518 [Fusarium fujikuroi]